MRKNARWASSAASFTATHSYLDGHYRGPKGVEGGRARTDASLMAGFMTLRMQMRDVASELPLSFHRRS